MMYICLKSSKYNKTYQNKTVTKTFDSIGLVFKNIPAGITKKKKLGLVKT